MAGEPVEVRVDGKPKAGGGDAAHLAVRVILTSIPGIGGAAKEIFNTVIAPPLAKRQMQWMESIANKLVELEEKVKGFTIENLSSNDNFISTVFYATTIAVRSHQQAKLDALRNAVLNSALAPKIEEDLQHMFLNFVDELTPSHLGVLKYFENPREWLRQREIKIPNWTYGAQIHAFNLAFPELKNQKGFPSQLIRDLFSRGLSLDESSMSVGVTGTSISSPHITEMGRQFLTYITSPIEHPICGEEFK